MAVEKDLATREIGFLLLCLLDSNNNRSRRMVLQRLLEIIPFGHHPIIYTETLTDPIARLFIREQYSEILNDIKLLYDLKKLLLAGKEEIDLETAVFLVSRFAEDRYCTPEEFAIKLDELAEPLICEIAKVHNDKEKLNIFKDYFFLDLGFKGNTEDYYDSKNSFITDILNTRTGLPITISALCLLLAKRLNLPFFGINLPGHFIIKYESENYSTYLDPFNEGNLLSKKDCLTFLSRQGLEPEPEYLTKTSSLDIMKRMYRNLINFYSAKGNKKLEKKLRQHLSILENAFISF